MEKIKHLFRQIYDSAEAFEPALANFLQNLEQLKQQHFKDQKTDNSLWYKDAVVYSMYVDYFNRDMSGIIDKLEELKQLGVNCLWLLPILDSPMKDAGFDIQDYNKIRPELLGDVTFDELIAKAHQNGIKIIFDIAMNHCSDQHPWFVQARQDRYSPYRDYFIWSDTGQEYPMARIIFKGLCTSNWQYDEVAGQYFFHRFFEIQPDLNYQNPLVLFEMTNVLIRWKLRGIDGFRADAIPFLWKQEGTICENHPKTHFIIKFFRAVMDYLADGTLFLAEACQPPSDVVAYFGQSDECQGAYHFPVMPRIYLALATQDKTPIEKTLNPSFTPDIPKDCQWFMFLRCHDELTLEMVTADERRIIYDYYAKDPLWDFRQQEGISARLANLFDNNPDRIGLAYSIMLTLLGTPIIYYGDEYGKQNDVDFYKQYSAQTGYPDSRYLARGPIDWDYVAAEMAKPDSLTTLVHTQLKQLIAQRKKHTAFSSGELTFIDVYTPNGEVHTKILSYIRSDAKEKLLILQNLSDQPEVIYAQPLVDSTDLFTQQKFSESSLQLAPYQFKWLKIDSQIHS